MHHLYEAMSTKQDSKKKKEKRKEKKRKEKKIILLKSTKHTLHRRALS